MAGAAAAAAIGAAGSMWSANKAASAQRGIADQTLSAQERMLQQQLGLAEPFLAQARTAMPALRGLAASYYAPRAGRESSLLRVGHEQSLSDIQRTAQRGLGMVQHYYAARGNSGRALGAELRVQDQATRARSSENLAYAGAQNQYQDTTAGQYAGILGNLTQFGLGALPGASNTFANQMGNVGQWGISNMNAIGGASQAFQSGLGDIAGTYIQQLLMKQILAASKK